jgi:hypothetical protein
MSKKKISIILLISLTLFVLYIASWYGALFTIKNQIMHQQGKIYNNIQMTFKNVEDSGFLQKMHYKLHKPNISFINNQKENIEIKLNFIELTIDPFDFSLTITLPNNINYKSKIHDFLLHFVRQNNLKVDLSFKELLSFLINKNNNAISLVSNAVFESSKMTVKNLDTHKIIYFSEGIKLHYNYNDNIQYIKLYESSEYISPIYKVALLLNSNVSIKKIDNINHYNFDKSKLEIGKLDINFKGAISQENNNINNMNMVLDFKNANSLPYVIKFLANEIDLKPLKILANNTDSAYSNLINILGYNNKSDNLQLRINKQNANAKITINDKNFQELMNVILVENIFKKLNKFLFK